MTTRKKSQPKLAPPQSEALIALARTANEHHALAESAFRQSVEHARSSGAALIEAKAQLGYGLWLPWLARNFEGCPRTAQGYMRLARAAPEEAQRVAHLGVGAALRALASGPDASVDGGRARADELRYENEWPGFIACARALITVRDRGVHHGTFAAWLGSIGFEPVETKLILALAEEWVGSHAEGELPALRSTIDRFRGPFAFVGDRLHEPRSRPAPRYLVAMFGPPPRVGYSRKPPWPQPVAGGTGMWDERQRLLVRRALADVLDVGKVVDHAVQIADPEERASLRRSRFDLVSLAQQHVDRVVAPAEESRSVAAPR